VYVNGGGLLGPHAAFMPPQDTPKKVDGGRKMTQISIKMEQRDVDALKKAADEQFITPAAMARAILLRTLRRTPEK